MTQLCSRCVTHHTCSQESQYLLPHVLTFKQSFEQVVQTTCVFLLDLC